MKNFTDLSVREKDGDMTFCLRSGLSVFEETLTHGVYVGSGINTAGYPLNVLSNFPTSLDPYQTAEPFAFRLELDGEDVCRKLEYIDHESIKTGDTLHVILTLESGVKPVQIDVHTVLDGTAVFSRWLTVKNYSDSPLSVSRLVIHGGGIDSFDLGDVSWNRRPDASKIYSLGYFGNDEWGREGEFDWHPLDNTGAVVDCRFGAGRYRHPAVFIKNDLSGNIYFAQTAFSAGCRFTVKADTKADNDRVSLGYSAEITGYKPLTVIAPDGEFTSPRVHFGAVHGGLDEAVNEMHAHTRRSVLDLPEADGSALFIGAGMGAEHDMSIETTKAFMRQTADMGAEVFIIDAGWVCPPGKETQWHRYNGKNKPDTERYPADSFAELRDICRENGMDFGLWCEIERLGDESGIKQQHPEWFAPDLFGSSGGVLDFTVPQAANWAENELARIITEYGLDLLRVDYNVSGKEVFGFRDTGTGREECLALRHYENVYKMYENLKKRFPDVIFENCAGGGGRTDLGMMRSFNHTWVSDNQKMPRSVTITNGMTMVLPPERVDRLFAGMGCHTLGELKAHMRNTMLTHMSLNVIAPLTAEPNGEAMDFIRHSTGVYKDFIRPFLPVSKVYHHTPTLKDVEKTGASVLEVASPDGDKSAIAAFSLNVPSRYAERPFEDRNTVVIFPRGIKQDRTYRVTLDNTGESFTEDGHKLLRHGIKVYLPSALSSELVLIEEALPFDIDDGQMIISI